MYFVYGGFDILLSMLNNVDGYMFLWMIMWRLVAWKKGF
jgi:hypothetical protein